MNIGAVVGETDNVLYVTRQKQGEEYMLIVAIAGAIICCLHVGLYAITPRCRYH